MTLIQPDRPLLWGAVAATFLSGAVMMSAGYVGRTVCWLTAGAIATLGGILILVSFALARQANRGDHGASAPTTIHRPRRSRVLATTLASGGVMVLAGYAASGWGWGLAAPLMTVGGLLISHAFAVDRPRSHVGAW